MVTTKELGKEILRYLNLQIKVGVPGNSNLRPMDYESTDSRKKLN